MHSIHCVFNWVLIAKTKNWFYLSLLCCVMLQNRPKFLSVVQVISLFFGQNVKVHVHGI